MTELVEIFGNIFVLADYQGHVTLKCHILLVKCETRFCRIKE